MAGIERRLHFREWPTDPFRSSDCYPELNWQHPWWVVSFGLSISAFLLASLSLVDFDLRATRNISKNIGQYIFVIRSFCDFFPRNCFTGCSHDFILTPFTSCFRDRKLHTRARKLGRATPAALPSGVFPKPQSKSGNREIEEIEKAELEEDKKRKGTCVSSCDVVNKAFIPVRYRFDKRRADILKLGCKCMNADLFCGLLERLDDYWHFHFLCES